MRIKTGVLILSLALELLLTSKAEAIFFRPQKCESVLRTETPQIELLKSNYFTVYRKLDDYFTTFGKVFTDKIFTMSNQDVWLDSGAGAASAILDYLSFYGVSRGKAIGLVYEKPSYREEGNSFMGIRSVRSQEALEVNEALERLDHALEDSRYKDRFRYMSGRLIENIPPAEIAPESSLTVITDYYGPTSYSKHLHLVLEIYGKLLKTGGLMFLKIAPETEKHGIIIMDINGKKIDLITFVEKYCRGFDVHKALLDKDKTYFTRNSDELFIPELEAIEYIANAPARIIYRMKPDENLDFLKNRKSHFRIFNFFRSGS